jgi:hypothetical protein
MASVTSSTHRGVAASDAQTPRDDTGKSCDADSEQTMESTDPRVVHSEVSKKQLKKKCDLKCQSAGRTMPRQNCENNPHPANGDQDATECSMSVVCGCAKSTGSGQKELDGYPSERERRNQAVWR